MNFDLAYPPSPLLKQTLVDLDRRYQDWLDEITAPDDIDDVFENQHDVVLALLITAVRVSHGTSWPTHRATLHVLLDNAIDIECQFPEDVR